MNNTSRNIISHYIYLKISIFHDSMCLQSFFSCQEVQNLSPSSNTQPIVATSEPAVYANMQGGLSGIEEIGGSLVESTAEGDAPLPRNGSSQDPSSTASSGQMEEQVITDEQYNWQHTNAFKFHRHLLNINLYTIKGYVFKISPPVRGKRISRFQITHNQLRPHLNPLCMLKCKVDFWGCKQQGTNSPFSRSRQQGDHLRNPQQRAMHHPEMVPARNHFQRPHQGANRKSR